MFHSISLMLEEKKTRKQLVQEVVELRRLVSELRWRESPLVDGLPHDFYRELVENTNDLIQAITSDAKFLYVNRAWLDTLGYSASEIHTLSVSDIIHPDNSAHCADLFQRLLAGDHVDMFQAELLARDGRKVVVEVSAHTHSFGGHPVYIQCVLRDITERRSAEETLRKLEALESSLLAAIPHAVVGLRDRKIVFANEAVEAVFGWRPEELTGKSTRVLYRNDEEYEEIGRRFYPPLEQRKTHAEDFRCRHKDGKDMICRVSASVIGQRLENKEIVVMYEDITERRRIEKALRESERKYFDLYRNAPDGYHSLGPDGTILEVNDTWLRMFGYERDEVVGRMKLTELLSDEGKEIFQRTFGQLREHGSIENVEYYVSRKDGSRVPVLISASAIYDKRGNFLKTRTIVRDISARMRFRSMLEQALEEWRITFDSMPCGVLMLDLDFTIKRVNKYIASLYDLTYKELLERKCYEVIRSETLQETYFGFASSFKISLMPFEYFEESIGRHFMLSLTLIPDTSGITKAFVLTMVDITDLKDKQKKLAESKEAFFNMLKELDVSYRELRELYDGLIHSFVNAIDAKSPWTKGHSERVTHLAVTIAEEIGLDDGEIENVRRAALLHDIGKIGTYDMILDNPKTLSAEEFDLINMHPVKGEEILKPIKQLEPILPIIRHHHERMDGGGYPDGLKGAEIPLAARILCVADSFDSMTSDRPYRPARRKEFAIAELKRCSGTQFDSRIVQAFLGVLDAAKIA
ncbi:MAG: PAS domain S-box protein [Nitrospirota bacterium]